MDDQLLIKYLIKKCTPEEINHVNHWALSDKANTNWLFEMERIWSLKDEVRFSERREIEAAYNQFISAIEKKNKQKKIWYHLKWSQYVAAILLVCLLAINTYVFYEKDRPYLNTIEVPAGQRVCLTLSDGTKVWLNSQSKFTYPSRFSRIDRKVNLEGEGFFEVVHNENKPFVVQSSWMDIKVLGTKFNIKAYPNERTYITLHEGQVEACTHDKEHTIRMNPREQIIYSPSQGLSFIQNVNIHITNRWINGELVFVNQTLEEIMCTLERKFGVIITIQDKELANEIFNCHTFPEATIEQILSLLQETRRLTYKIKGKTISINNNKK